MDDILNLSAQYTAEERLFSDSVRRWVQTQAKPRLAAAYEAGEFPADFIKGLADLGVFSIKLPPEYGGPTSPVSTVAYGLVCEALEAGDSGLRSVVSVQNSLCIYPILRFGSKAQHARYLPKLGRGEFVGCFGLTEPNAGSDPAGMQTTAQRTSSGWLLNGSKQWISQATLADVAIVWAKQTDAEGDEAQRVRGFIVEKNTPGFKQSPIKHKLSLRASDTGELHFTNCEISHDQQLPGTSMGLGAALSCLTQARFGIAWGVLGAAMACFDLTLDYLKQRQQFGKPLASFQLIQRDLVDCFTDIVRAQALNEQLAREADRQPLAAPQVSLAKMNAVRAALNVARQCRNLLGANGITLDYEVMRHMNNLESVFTYEGTDNIHHLILGQYLTGIAAFQ